MRVLDELNMAYLAHPERLHRIVLSVSKYVEFVRACNLCRVPGQHGTDYRFMNVPVVLEAPTLYCRGCGAPAEPGVCSFCRTPSEYIRLE